MNKHMLRAFGLSLFAALGLMAFAAVGAQAEELKGDPGKIIILGKENLHASATGEQIGAGTLLIPGLNVEIVCQKVDVVNGLILSSTDAHADVLYLECVYWGTKGANQELTTTLPCEILEEGTLAKGSILAKALLLPILHGSTTPKDSYILVEPLETNLAGILVTTPSECPLPKLVSVTGSIVFKVTLSDLNLEKEETHVTIESSKAINQLFSDKLLFGVNESFIDGKALIKLTGAHTGCTWGVI